VEADWEEEDLEAAGSDWEAADPVEACSAMAGSAVEAKEEEADPVEAGSAMEGHW